MMIPATITSIFVFVMSAFGFDYLVESEEDVAPNGTSDCPLRGEAISGMSLSGCTTVASDTAEHRDPRPVWGLADCERSSRLDWVESGGDRHPTASGEAQGDSAFRRLSVIDGDGVDDAGERCELGYNWNEASDPNTGIEGPGPTVFYREGRRRVTFASLRLPSGSDVDDPKWRVALQMKQTQPYNNDGSASMFELQVRDGNWLLISDWTDLWRAPAEAGVWTRFILDVTYSQDPAIGSIRAYVDLNGDGDTGDDGEQSPEFHRATLLRETSGGDGAVPAGGSVPSHLRAGLYQDKDYDCPSPSSCSMDVDNVQVLAP